MSQADIQRFVSDLKENQALLDEVKSGAVGLASVVELAQSKGYDITMDEAKAYIRGQASQELSDEQLDAVAGGKGHHHHHSVGTKVSVAAVEAAVSVTSAVQTAEAVTTVAEAADVATTVEVAAEVAIVAT